MCLCMFVYVVCMHFANLGSCVGDDNVILVHVYVGQHTYMHMRMCLCICVCMCT
jgi:hypothetical protein